MDYTIKTTVNKQMLLEIIAKKFHSYDWKELAHFLKNLIQDDLTEQEIISLIYSVQRWLCDSDWGNLEISLLSENIPEQEKPRMAAIWISYPLLISHIVRYDDEIGEFTDDDVVEFFQDYLNSIPNWMTDNIAKLAFLYGWFSYINDDDYLSILVSVFEQSKFYVSKTEMMLILPSYKEQYEALYRAIVPNSLYYKWNFSEKVLDIVSKVFVKSRERR